MRTTTDRERLGPYCLSRVRTAHFPGIISQWEMGGNAERGGVSVSAGVRHLRAQPIVVAVRCSRASSRAHGRVFLAVSPQDQRGIARAIHGRPVGFQRHRRHVSSAVNLEAVLVGVALKRCTVNLERSAFAGYHQKLKMRAHTVQNAPARLRQALEAGEGRENGRTLGKTQVGRCRASARVQEVPCRCRTSSGVEILFALCYATTSSSYSPSGPLSSSFIHSYIRGPVTIDNFAMARIPQGVPRHKLGDSDPPAGTTCDKSITNHTCDGPGPRVTRAGPSVSRSMQGSPPGCQTHGLQSTATGDLRT
ncbi:hypothetical protein C8Q80DRAFT_351198 [Daedaleopsis nitida]|nr:hypothetical protein C8Q80DRAFT_351198 [Daedaleopsis nitida]